MKSAFDAAYETITGITDHAFSQPTKQNHANSIFVFIDGWDALLNMPFGVDHIFDLVKLTEHMKATKATQFRRFIYDDDGRILYALGVYDMRSRLKDYAPSRIGMAQVLLTHLNFSLGVLQKPVVEQTDDVWAPSQDMRKLLKAAYDRNLPPASRDPDMTKQLIALL
ncbi:hypothetical protein RCCS2_00307 [Roseobacter sp. CCS2]|nr:hypothetical protein RCCS2_00307 [Roseobacter sp. CCS2]